MESLQTTMNLSRNLKSFKPIQRVSRQYGNFSSQYGKFIQSGNFPDNLEQIQAIRKLSRQSGKFIDNPESFQTVWKPTRQYEKIKDYLEIFQTKWKLSRQYENFPDILETF